MSISSKRRFRDQSRRRLQSPSRRRVVRLSTWTAPDIRGRLVMVWLIFMLGLVGLTANLFRLQIIEGDRLLRIAREQQSGTVRSFVPRHTITDRNGAVLALDQPVYDVYVHPALFSESSDQVALKLAPILDLPIGELLYRLSQSETGIRLAARVDPSVAEDIQKLKLNGVDLEPQQRRYYPYSSVFAHLIGYVNLDQEGQIGVEATYNDRLVGARESFDVVRTGYGDVLPNSLSPERIHEEQLTLQLTIDSHLQQMAHERLMAQLAQYDTNRGTVIVMNVNDGAIAAMVTEPSFDPNTYYDADQETFRNWAVSDALEPGSTFKPINLAIALDNEAVQVNDTFYDGGFIQVGEWVIKNSDFDEYGGHGQVDVTDILKQSSNVGMIQIMQRLSSAVYYRWLERLGVERQSGIDLPVEGVGNLKSFDDFTRGYVESATASFGQGLSVTPIHLLQMQAAIANGGKLVTPHVTQGFLDSTGEMYWQPPQPKPRTIFKQETAQQVLEMMEAVVKEGTGRSAQIENYRIAGKTGTAQKASRRGGYDESAKTTSFVGIFPVEDPKYVVLTIIDEPKGSNLFGSTVAAPVVKSVIEFLIAREGIPSPQAAPRQTRPSVEDAETLPSAAPLDP
ncbi:MAG: penicillin-binding protein 2 [Leptolyngbyaceae bacterium]|nr:penicillin-binding protein 2 [Leptolyngbyaceae bacterium]